MSIERYENQIDTGPGRPDQRGTATLTAVLILGLLAVFTAATLSRVTTEALVMGNDYSNTQAFYAAQASLELMSRNFNKIFDVQLRPSAADLDRIKTTTPTITAFRFVQDIRQDAASSTKPIEDGPFSGLMSLRTPWDLQAVATYANGAQAQLTRTFYNHQIPIFQFGIFYNDDMELHPGPNFNFGGRVHSNGNLFMMCGSNLYFRSRVTAVGEVITDTSRMGLRSGDAGWSWNGKVWVADSSNTFREVVRGSVLKLSSPNTQATDPDMPNWTKNATWSQDLKVFSGNLLANQPKLQLPLQIGTNDDPIEIVKRGITGESAILRDSRYYNKPGIRVSLSDSQGRLPGGTGGLRLDGKYDGLGAASGSQANAADGTRGYKPRAMNDGYQAKRVNGHRFYTGPSYTDAGMPPSRENWIKVEIVTQNSALQPVAQDVTEDFLSLGLTHKDAGGLNIGDDRAILKMQRYEMIGPPLKVAATSIQATQTNATTPAALFTLLVDARTGVGAVPVCNYRSAATPNFNYVATSRRDATTQKWLASVIAGTDQAVAAQEGTAPLAAATTLTTTPPTEFEVDKQIDGIDYRVVPFPIKMYSSREGLYNEDLPEGSVLSPGSSTAPSWWYLYTGTSPGVGMGTTSKVPVVGVLSVIDIDMGNLDRFLSGTWNGQFPNGLKSSDIPDNGGSGCIIYVSDRRGDRDNDGEYDMEDIYGPNDGVIQPGEDVNHNGTLEADYLWEADRYNVSIESDVAALIDWKYFRRAVRVINGQTLTAYGTLNRGYSVASENGLYTLGNFNATGITAVGTPSQPADYSGSEVPASLVADAVTILSKEWNDAKSFRNPCDYGTRVVDAAGETAVRAALLMGDTRSSLRVAGRPNQGGGDSDLAGGVHNFPRFLENWGGNRFNYCGSLINLFNSRQHDGAHKNGGKTYSPPTRNWVFNTAFLDINRLPPGTPFFQYIQMTGFRQTVRQIQ
ncbi:MAG TPA: hypothetical protein VGV87_15960 [Blastocatellia bacterium]|nr:hypothetical protein [Blastocatellia bacterium]